MAANNGETVLASATPARAMWTVPYLFTLGAAEAWRRRNVVEVTNRRVVFRKGIVTKNERSLPREKVQDVNVTSQLGLARLTITSAGGGPGRDRDGVAACDRRTSDRGPPERMTKPPPPAEADGGGSAAGRGTGHDLESVRRGRTP